MASVADVRQHPKHAAEQVTQALQGEVLQPLLRENGWVLVRVHDGYVGWIRSWHLELAGPERSDEHAHRANARIAASWVRLHESPYETAGA